MPFLVFGGPKKSVGKNCGNVLSTVRVIRMVKSQERFLIVTRMEEKLFACVFDGLHSSSMVMTLSRKSGEYKINLLIKKSKNVFAFGNKIMF